MYLNDSFYLLTKNILNDKSLNDGCDESDIFLNDIYGTLCVYNIKDIFVNGNFKHNYIHDNSIKKIIFNDSMRYNGYSCDSIIYPFIDFNKSQANLEIYHNNNYIRYFVNDNYLNANFITTIEKDRDESSDTFGEFFIKHYGNKNLLGKIFNPTNKYNYKLELFINLLHDNIKNDNKRKCQKSIDNILKNTEKFVNKDALPVSLKDKSKAYYDVSLKDNVKLYNYQINDILWMQNLQYNIDNCNNIIYTTYNSVNNVKLDNNYLLYNRSLIPSLSDDNITETYSIKYYGGNIISQVGLGKSLIVLCYIMNNFNEFNRFVEFENENCNYFYKRGINKSKVCIKKKEGESLYCKEHLNTLFIDKRSVKYKNLNNFNIRNYIEHDYKKYFKTNASIIICPNHLCDQWVREYYEKFKQEDAYAKRILLVVTCDQYKNLTFGDILFADVIIISFNFLINSNYQNQKVEIPLEPLDLCKHYNVGFNDFYYKNLIVDETHEANENKLMLQIQTLKSQYRWNISATPFVNGLDSFIHNTRITTSSKIVLNDDLINKCSILYKRNTRESIKNEYTGNIIVDTVKLLKFTEQEQHIYDSYIQGNSKSNRDFIIKLCCDTSIDTETKSLVKNCRTLAEIELVLLTHNKQKMLILKKTLDEYNIKIDELLKIIDRCFVIDELNEEFVLFKNIEDVKVEIGNFRRKVTNTKKDYESINRTYIYLKNVIDNIKTSETCPICLDDSQTEIAITKCGHKFCKDCIHEYVEEMSKKTETKCPKCNIPIKIDEIYILKEQSDVEKNVEINELSSIIQRVKSTKIGNIIYYIKNELLENDKCIIFSQWDLILKKIANILEQEYNILYCKGTIYQKKKSIKAFQEDPMSKIMLLSSNECAAGINLTCANKIILVEPIYGSKQYRTDIENQAIGRADRLSNKRPIEVIRFIIKDTIEEDIINENNIERQLVLEI